MSILSKPGFAPSRRAPVGDPREPFVFVRTLATPPGAPWDQARSAELEARLGAPLPLSEVVYRTRRLGGWAPGRPARYVACYVRRIEAGKAFSARVDVDGRQVVVRFVSTAEQGRRLRQWGIAGAVALAAALGLMASVGSALSTRSDAEARLAAAEQLAGARLREAEALRRRSLQARALNKAGARDRTLEAVLADFAWASGAKTTGARLDGVHWENGYLAVEARGDAAPFASGDRTLLKAAKPIRPGVWLWGVGPKGSDASRGARP